MINEITDPEALEALIDKRVNEKLKNIFHGRNVQPAEPTWVELYGKKHVLAGVIAIGTLLTGGFGSLSIGSVYWYYKATHNRDYGSSDRIMILMIAFSTACLTVLLAFTVLRMSCNVIRTKPAQISEI